MPWVRKLSLSLRTFSRRSRSHFSGFHTCSRISRSHTNTVALKINQSVVYDHRAFSFPRTHFLHPPSRSLTLYEASRSFMTMFYFFHIIIIVIVMAFMFTRDSFFSFLLLACAKEKVRERRRNWRVANYFSFTLRAHSHGACWDWRSWVCLYVMLELFAVDFLEKFNFFIIDLKELEQNGKWNTKIFQSSSKLILNSFQKKLISVGQSQMPTLILQCVKKIRLLIPSH